MSRVLALKYRPKRFSDLIGQESISQTLSLALSTDKLSHAYLFSGLRGSGKTSTARIFAKALVCEKAPSAEPCGVCAGCISAEEGRHLDIIEMDAASNRGIDDIRQLIESTKYKPAQAKYKIYIIDEVHMLSTPAFNALLKTLEEPPAYVKFVLATTDPIKLPPTILSRTIHFRFKKIGHTDVVEHLKHILAKEGIGFEDEALEFIARNGSGSLRDTLTLLDQAIVYSKGFVSKDSVVELLGAVNPDKIKELFGLLLKKDRDAAIMLAKEFEEYEAENVVNEIIEFLKEAISKKNRTIPIFALERFFRIAISSKELLYMGADGAFVITLMVLKMIEAMEIEDIESIISKYESEVEYSKAASNNNSKQKKMADDAIHDSALKQHTVQAKWEKLIEAIYSRSYDVGKAFEKNIVFVAYENSVLTWSSCAENEERELLAHYYSEIKHIVKDIYGIDTIIKVQKSEPKKIDERLNQALDTLGNEVGQKAKLHEQKPDKIEIDNIGEEGSECAHGGLGLFADGDENEKTLDEEAAELSLLKHPLVEKSKEIFGISDDNISIFQKV